MSYKLLSVAIVCVTLGAAASAQAGSGLSTSCQGSYGDPPGTCSFMCVAGQPIQIYGFTERPAGDAFIQVIAYCNDVEIVQCQAAGHAAIGCSATSSIVPDSDGVGTCYVTGSIAQSSEFSCTSVTP